MWPPEFDRPNYGGMAGIVVGGIGGLFALFIVPALTTGNVQWLVYYRLFNIIAWLVSLPIGWGLGWLIGRPLGNKFQSQRAEIVGGILGGVLTISLIAAYGWYLAKSHK